MITIFNIYSVPRDFVSCFIFLDLILYRHHHSHRPESYNPCVIIRGPAPRSRFNIQAHTDAGTSTTDAGPCGIFFLQLEL